MSRCNARRNRRCEIKTGRSTESTTWKSQTPAWKMDFRAGVWFYCLLALNSLMVYSPGLVFFYEQEVDSAIANLLTMIEPLLIAFLGVTIGSIVIAMYLPLFTL